MNDKFTVRAVVVFLGAFALIALAATTWLVHDGVAAEAVAVVSGAMGVALGALGGLLASVRVADSTVPPAPAAAAPVLPTRAAMAAPAVGDAAP